MSIEDWTVQVDVNDPDIGLVWDALDTHPPDWAGDRWEDEKLLVEWLDDNVDGWAAVLWPGVARSTAIRRAIESYDCHRVEAALP